MSACELCGCVVGDELCHAQWHDQLGARLDLLEAHSENLIERVFHLEQVVDRLVQLFDAPRARPASQVARCSTPGCDEAMVGYRFTTTDHLRRRVYFCEEHQQ